MDLSAQSIGGIFLRAHDLAIDTNDLLIECGNHLKAKKDTLEQGEWLPWLEANSKTLGFGERTAQKLIKAATSNPTLTSDLPYADQLKINRVIWGNLPKATPRLSREPDTREDSRTVATVEASTEPADVLDDEDLASEVAWLDKQEQEFQESLARVVETVGDPAAAFVHEIKKQGALIAQKDLLITAVTQRRDEYMDLASNRLKELENWKRTVERSQKYAAGLEQANQKLQSENEALRERIAIMETST